MLAEPWWPRPIQASKNLAGPWGWSDGSWVQRGWRGGCGAPQALQAGVLGGGPGGPPWAAQGAGLAQGLAGAEALVVEVWRQLLGAPRVRL